MKKLYYFAYGSNLLSAQLRDRIGHYGPLIKVANYSLPNYELVFNASFSTHFAGYANIVRRQGAHVEGTLWEVTDRQLQTLDRYEGLYEKQFFIAPDGNVAAVYVCTDPECLKGNGPALPYLNRILDGAKEQGLKVTYNRLVDLKNSAFKLKGNRHKKLL